MPFLSCRPRWYLTCRVICITFAFLSFINILTTNHFIISQYTKNDVLSSWDTAELPVMKSTKKGWHPVYVYYGNDDAINRQLASPGYLEEALGSQVDQDKIILALYSKYRNLADLATSSTRTPATDATITPYFVDLAANDAVVFSNTYRLEENGWTGLCIEPNPWYWYRLAHRNCAIAGTFVGGKNDADEVNVTLENGANGGIVGEDFDNKNATTVERRTVSIVTVFKAFNVPKIIDYLSLDVEGAELLVMNDFPFDEYVVRFLTIERPNKNLRAVLKSHGYEYLMMLVHWGDTLWTHKSVLNVMSNQTMIDIVKNVSGYVHIKPVEGEYTYNFKKARVEYGR